MQKVTKDEFIGRLNAIIRKVSMGSEFHEPKFDEAFKNGEIKFDYLGFNPDFKFRTTIKIEKTPIEKNN